MRIASQCHERALLLLQIAQECPKIRDEAVYLAREWLNVAAIRLTCLDMIDRFENEERPN
jgi:hypothetical protein